ncbi:MAG: hypothetical protein R6W84_04390 [Promethearchaeia archaeon]
MDRSRFVDTMAACAVNVHDEDRAYDPLYRGLESHAALLPADRFVGVIYTSGGIYRLVGKSRVFVHHRQVASLEMVGDHPLFGLSHHYCKECRLIISQKSGREIILYALIFNRKVVGLKIFAIQMKFFLM